MAVDEAISMAFRQGKAPPTLRIYQWAQPAVTLGYFQSIPTDPEPDVPRSPPMQIIRRITGGGAVYHGQDLTYSVVASQNSPVFSNQTLAETFRTLSRALVCALDRLGLNTEIHESSHQTVRSAQCFTAPSRFEILLDGRKVIGSAQRRWVDGFLQQGSLLMKFDPRPLERLFRSTRESTTGKGVGINDFSERLFSPGDLESAVISGFEEILDVTFSPGRLSQEEQQLAIELSHDKYSREEWNFHRKNPMTAFDKRQKTAKI